VVALSELYGGGGSGSFEVVGSQTFTSSGTWTKPAGIKPDDIVVIDAWGGGGSSQTDGSNYGGGGGGGQHRRHQVRANALAATETALVGAGGTGGLKVSGTTGSGQAGGEGGDSTFTISGSAVLIANGGKGANYYGSGGFGGGSVGRATHASNSQVRPSKWGGGISGNGITAVDYPIYSTDHGGASGGSHYTSNSDRTPAGDSIWGVLADELHEQAGQAVNQFWGAMVALQMPMGPAVMVPRQLVEAVGPVRPSRLVMGPVVRFASMSFGVALCPKISCSRCNHAYSNRQEQRWRH
jgi:Glycine-rich domain